MSLGPSHKRFKLELESVDKDVTLGEGGDHSAEGRAAQLSLLNRRSLATKEAPPRLLGPGTQ